MKARDAPRLGRSDHSFQEPQAASDTSQRDPPFIPLHSRLHISTLRNMRIPSNSLSSLTFSASHRQCLSCRAHRRAVIRLIASRTSPAVQDRRRWNSTLVVEKTQSPQTEAILHGKPGQHQQRGSGSQSEYTIAPHACKHIHTIFS